MPRRGSKTGQSQLSFSWTGGTAGATATVTVAAETACHTTLVHVPVSGPPYLTPVGECDHPHWRSNGDRLKECAICGLRKSLRQRKGEED